jgi:hypothetical protein
MGVSIPLFIITIVLFTLYTRLLLRIFRLHINQRTTNLRARRERDRALQHLLWHQITGIALLGSTGITTIVSGADWKVILVAVIAFVGMHIAATMKVKRFRKATEWTMISV